jgi:predicted permease
MRWIMRLFRRGRLERELDAELWFHVDEEVRRLEADGLTPDEARRRALAAFGGIEPAKEQARDARGTRWLEDLGRDLRYGLRLMRRSPGFAAAAILSLAVGIGANGTIFGLASALLLRPLDVERPGQLYFLNRAGYDDPNYWFSYPDFGRLRVAVPDVDFAAFGSITRVQVDRGSGSELVLGQLVSGNYFDLLGVRASAGRVLTPADTAKVGSAPVVVVSRTWWVRELGADPGAIGSTMRVNGVPLTIVGVTAGAFSGLEVGQPVSLWLPATMQHELRLQSNASVDNADESKPWLTQDGIKWATLVARVPANVGRASAAARIAAFEHRELKDAAAKITDTAQRAYRLREHVELVPGSRGQSDLRDDFSQPLGVLMVTVGIVLLIACANLASLLLARSTARTREFALRVSLGAGRGRLVRQLLTESLMLAALGGLAGLGLAELGGHALLRMASSGSAPIPLDLPVDWRLVGFTLAVSAMTGLLFGLGPAVHAARAGIGDPLRAGTRVTSDEWRPGHFAFGRVLIVVQVALSLALLVGAVLFVRTFRNLMAADEGFDQTSVVLAQFDPRLAGLRADQLPALYARLLDAARRVPGATSASLGLTGPVTGSARMSTVQIDDEPMRPGTDSVVREDFVWPGYFRTTGMTMQRGRAFSDQDDVHGQKVAIVNQTMARHFFGGVDPVGHRLGYDTPTDVRIVGVVRDARMDGPREAVPPMVYYPLRQHPDEFAGNLYVRVRGTGEGARAPLRTAMTAAEPELAVRQVVTLAELTERTVSASRLLSELTGFFGLLAIAVACLGLYGTLSYSVSRRANEIGVRLALGASPAGVRWLVVRETLALLAGGSAGGLVVAWAACSYLGAQFYGLSPHDPITYACAAAGLVAVGLLAGALPARRASRVDPLVALRAE